MKVNQTIVSRLASLEIYAVLLAVTASVIQPRLLVVALGVTVFFAFIRCIPQRRFSLRTPADVGILFLFLTAGITSLISVIPDVTLPQVYRLMLGIGLYYAIVNWGVTERRLTWLVTGLILGSMGLALYATISVAWIHNKLPIIPSSLYNRFVTLVDDTVHHNVMAGILAIILPVGLSLVFFSWRELPRWGRISNALISIVVMAILVLTQSRGGLIAFGVALVALLSLRFRWGWLTVLIAAVCGGLLINFIGIEQIFDSPSTGVYLNGFEGRIEIWERAFYMIQDFPITGIGMGLFGEVADLLYPFFISASGTIPHAHNLFLQLAVDLGIPGLIAWLAVLMTVTSVAWKVYRKGWNAKEGLEAGLGAGLLACQVALIVHGMVDAVTWGMVKTAPVVWALWGLTMASWNVYRKPDRDGGS